MRTRYPLTKNQILFENKDIFLKLLVVFVPLALLAFLIYGNMQSWKSARKLSRQLTLNQSAAVAEELALRLDLLVQKGSRGLALLSNLWREAPTKNHKDTFLKWAKGLVITDQAFDLILYLDANNITMVTRPANNGKPLAGLDIQSRPAKEDFFKTLRKSIAPLDALPTARITSKGGLVLWFPVLVEKPEGPSVTGTVAGSLLLKGIVEKALTPLIRRDFWIEVSVKGQEIFNNLTTAPENEQPASDLQGEKVIKVVGLDWQVVVRPKGGGAYRKLAPSDNLRLAMQVVLSILVSGLLGISLMALHRVRLSQRGKQRSEKRYQTLVDSAMDGIMVLDFDGVILNANSAACTSLGFMPDELIKKNIGDLLDSDSFKKLPVYLEELKTGEPLYCEMTHLTRTGNRIPVETSLCSFEFQGTPAVLSMSRDISQRKQAVSALAESERRLRAIFEQAGVGIMQCGPDDRIQQVNDKLCGVTGYTQQELTTMSYWDLFFAEDRPKTEAHDKKMREDPTHPGLWQKRLRHKSGRPIWTRMTTALVRSDKGDYLYSIDVMEDITDQRRLEQQLRQAQKMESIGTLAGGIAHDFNNILGSILGFTQMVLIDSNPIGKTRKRLEHVFKAANLAKDLVRQILTFSRQAEDDPHAIQVSPIIKETLKFLKASLPANIEIRQDIKPEEGAVMADPTQIHQILMNLCTNAAQAMSPEGGILEVTLDTETLNSEPARHLDLATGSYMVLTVKDNGLGIEAYLLERIFEPYFTTKEIGEGTGMGLALVHSIVKEYEGTVVVESVDGDGSTFKVYLPKTQSSTSPQPGNIPNLPVGSEQIMLIDDNQSILSVGREMLEHLGYHVETYADAIQGLERLTTSPQEFQVVITDQTMPRMTGVQLADRILQTHPDLAVILCTGNSKNLDFKKLLHSGIDSILLKPLVIEELAPAIRSALTKKRQDNK